jgi:uncharacterized protein (DUF302 family)
MKARLWMAVVTIAALFSAPLSYAADEELGIFEMLRASNVSFDETTAALETALGSSELKLQATHDVRVPGDLHKARVYVLTSPAYADAARDEGPNTISAQILRMAVYSSGEEQATYINMANPVAHAMVFYADSSDYDNLLAAARNAAGEMREVAASVPGEAVSQQQEPIRSEKHYNKYKGDGPARMMAKFRTFEKSQLEILEDSADNFDEVVAKVRATIDGSSVSDAEETTGWETVAVIRLRDDAVYIGVTNPYIEDRMVQINSRFRTDGKSEASPYPGVDHVSALPTDILVVKDGSKTRVLQYGQMWRMQLYFWDSGYRAFTANVGVPSAIANSIEDTVTGN